MKKMYMSAFIGKITFLVLCGLSFLVPVTAQTVVINTGTPGIPAYNAGPIYRSTAGSAYDASRYTYLFTQDELAAVGITPGAMISQVGWAKNNSATTNGGAIFRVFMKNSTATTFALASETWANLITGATMVYENLSQTIPATTAPAFIPFTLNTPFTYTGGSLEISTEWDINAVAGNATTATFEWLWNTVTDRIYGTGQTVLANAGTLSSTSNSISDIDNRRPLTQLTFTPGGPCTNPPTPGTATSSTANTCLGVPFTLTYSGGTNGTGQTIQWQSSPDGVAWTDIPGATSAFFTTSQTVTTQYRVLVTCGVGVGSNVVIVNSPVAVQGTFTIDKTLPPSATNFQSFNAAYDFIRCGISGNVIFNVFNGPYNEQLIMTEVPLAAIDRTVTFNGNGQAIEFISANTNERAVIKLNGADFINFNNLVVNTLGSTTTDFGFGFHLMNDANNNSIIGCTINMNTTSTSANYAGIVVSGSATSSTGTGSTLSDDNIIANNTINGGYLGISLVGSTTEANRNNVITGNTVNDFHNYGIYVNGTFGTIVEGNTIQRPTRSISATTAYGIYFTSLSVSAEVSRNKISNPFGGDNGSTNDFHGIFFTGVDAQPGLENRVVNNAIYNFTGSGNVVGINNTSSDNLFIYHNTISLDGDAPLTSNSNYSRGIYQTTSAFGIDIKNNIISITRGGASNKHGFYFNTPASSITSNYNNIYIEPTVTNAFVGFGAGANQATLANWQTATSQDANSVSVAPIFAGAVAGNFTPTNASLDNLGTPVGVTNDIDNAVRSATTPDMGAVEFTPGPCTNPPSPGTVTSSTVNTCHGVPFTLIYSGGTFGTGQTIQWQSSPDGVTWTDIPGATSLSLNTTQTATTQYRVLVTCGVSVGSAAVTVNSPALIQGDYTIDRLLPASATNFQSFNAAYDFIRCGISGHVRFHVANGPYNEQLIMTEVPNAAIDRTVTFNGNGQVIEFVSINTNERAVIKLNGADHIHFNNLVVNSPGTTTSEYGFGFHLMNDANNNSIVGCTINLNTTSTSANYAGIVVSGSNTSSTGTGSTLSDDNIIANNTINGGLLGISLVGSATEANRNNVIISNTINDFHTYGIYVLGSFGTIVEGNNIQRPTRTVSAATAYGIYFTNLSVSAEITKNRISNPFGGDNGSTNDFNGIFFTGNDGFSGLENRIVNNLIYNLTGSGDVVGINNTGSDNVLIYHNTISIDGDATLTTATNYARGFYQTTQAANIDFKNNIISITRGGASQKHALYFNTAASVITSDFNNIYISPTVLNGNVGFSNATNRPSLASWQAATSLDLNSINIEPVFAGPLAGNFLPTNASMNDLGTPLGITTDIDNATRSATAPDMGAYEFTPLPCVAPPTAGTAMLSDDNVCQNELVSLFVNGNSNGLTQTYQWESSPNFGGPWTAVGTSVTNPNITITASTTLYYRLGVTCSGNTQFTAPVLLTVTPGLTNQPYTINGLLPTGGLNYNSFNDAYAALACGIVDPITFEVNPAGGPYVEQLIMDPVFGSSALRTITFKGNGAVIRFSPTVTGERAVIKLRGADHIIFDSLVIDASDPNATYGFAVHMLNDADSNVVRNSRILSNTSSTSAVNFAGVVISSSETSANATGATRCDGNLIENNTIIGGHYGITLTGSTAEPVLNNRFINNRVQDFNSYGIYMNTVGATLVEGNDISRPTRTIMTTFYGVYGTGVSNNVQVSKNKIHNPFDGDVSSTQDFFGVYFTGFDANGGSENVVSNNLIYKVNGEGDQTGLYNTGSDFANYFHNTIVLDDPASFTTLTTRGFYQTTVASGIKVRNNIFTLERAGTSIQHALYFNTNGSNIESDRNILHVTPGSTSYTGRINATDYITLAQWQAGSAQDAGSLDLDPEYANPLVNDYTPTLGAVDNLGLPVGITTDINNAVRSATTPDAGAYEFTVPPCLNPPIAGTTEITPNSGICIGTTVLLTLSGNSIGGGQTYQWQMAPSATGPWSNIGPVLNGPVFQWAVTTQTFFQAVISCSGNTVTSPVASVTLNPFLEEGTYTINPALPPSATNFQSFQAAVSAMDCGIGGDVFFDAVPGTYNEQIRIRAIGNANVDNRVTFRSQNGDRNSVILTFDATTSAAGPHTLKLDSASYITFMNMTIRGTGTGGARAVEIAGTATTDSIYNCVLTVPNVTSTATTVAGIYGASIRGADHTIKNNEIRGGFAGISLAGISVGGLIPNLIIDSNDVAGFYQYGIYTNFTKRINLIANRVAVTGPATSPVYGIYSSNADTAMNVSRNRVTVSNLTGIGYGMYFTSCDANNDERGRVMGNKIVAINGNSGTLYGLYFTATVNANVLNNVSNVSTSASTAYAIYSQTGGGGNFWNNTAQNSSTAGGTTNVAGFFSQTTLGVAGIVNIRNNIFSHPGGGIALFIQNVNFIYSDYNFLYTTGGTLVRRAAPAPAVSFATLEAWKNDSYWDVNSIVYPPAFTNSIDLEPDVDAPDVWAMHGRGVQILGNNVDFNNNPRPTTLTAGVPDMGAFEFVPTSLPTVLTAIPAAPAPGITQTFMYGTDTVTKITYAAGSTVPTNVELRRYSGVLPPNLATGQPSTYFYTDADITGPQPSNIKVEQYYIDPWQGFIPVEESIKLGRTDATNSWLVNPNSTVDPLTNIFSDASLNFLDKFTGLTDGTIPPDPPIILPPADSSNRGTHFWVGYGHHQGFEGQNNQDMVLYFSAEQPANVTVKINGTAYVKNYVVPANSVITSDILPKTGIYDARLLVDGKSDRGISIVSDVPIVAYAHIYGPTMSDASLLLPVSTYGTQYTALTTRQNYATDTYSWAIVVAAYDSTRVEITPANRTLNGRPADVPFVVNLNKGEIYQVLGAILPGSTAEGYDMTGTLIKAIPNDNGRCLPIAVFSGSSRTNIGCGNSNPSGSGDNILEQNFPYSAWGKKYLVASTSNSGAANSLQSNVYRVAVKDPATVVTVNGVQLTNLVDNFYYQFESSSSDVIEADQPIIVAQIMVSSFGSGCPSISGSGDPSMIYVSPVEQGIKRAGMYRNTRNTITTQYLTLIIPNAGLASLRIDGQQAPFDHQYTHADPNYTVVVKRWSPTSSAQVIVESDSAFTAIMYGYGTNESYGYNAGTLVRNLNSRPSITNVRGNGQPSPYTCLNTPFAISTQLSVKPVTLTWNLSAVPQMTPNANVIENNPVPSDSTLVNGTMFYTFNLPGTFSVSAAGQFVIPIVINHPDIEGCNNSLETSLLVDVRPSPSVDFTVNSGCLGDPSTFTAATTSNGVNITAWNWDFGNGETETTSSHTLTYSTPGTYNVTLDIVTQDGCVGDSTVPVVIGDRPTVTVVDDSLSICGGSTATFEVQSPQPGITYTWWDSQTGGTLLHTGATFPTTATSNTVYWLEAAAGSCISVNRVRVALGVGNTLSVSLVQSVFEICSEGPVTFEVLNPIPGATYTWYDAQTGGTVVNTGTTFTIPNASASVIYYVEGQSGTCLPDTRTPATINFTAGASIALVEDTLAVCGTGDVTFAIQNPIAGTTYNWYDAETGGTIVHTGATYTVTGVTGPMEFWVEGAVGPCRSARVQAVITHAVSLDAPVVSVSEEGPDFVTFTWNGVPLAAGYSVSTDNGVTWTQPSSGAAGLTHTVSGLTPDQSVTLIVRSELGTACASGTSTPVTGSAKSSAVFVPNSFTPNGDGLNDVLQVYGNSVESLRFMVFNQWGEKLSESTNKANVWDGKQGGKLQPSGVYMYVTRIVMRDGTVINKKGSINLIR